MRLCPFGVGDALFMPLCSQLGCTFSHGDSHAASPKDIVASQQHPEQLAATTTTPPTVEITTATPITTAIRQSPHGPCRLHCGGFRLGGLVVCGTAGALRSFRGGIGVARCPRRMLSHLGTPRISLRVGTESVFRIQYGSQSESIKEYFSNCRRRL